MKVTVLLMDPLASLETVDIVMKLVHYRGKTLPGRESSSNVTTILGTVETRLTITPPSVEEQIKPSKMLYFFYLSLCSRLLSCTI